LPQIFKKKLMNTELKEKVEKRLKLIGMKKSFLANKMGISTSQLSQTLSGTRKLQIDEETLLRNTLNL